LMVARIFIDVVGLAPWVAHLIIGGVLAALGAGIIGIGLSRLKQVDPVPRETIETLREDVSWITDQNQSEKT
jgi:Putative Actinobacterial Holin-X, holin superfamily III